MKKKMTKKQTDKMRLKATKASKNKNTLGGLLPNIGMVNKKKAKLRKRVKKG